MAAIIPAGSFAALAAIVPARWRVRRTDFQRLVPELIVLGLWCEAALPLTVGDRKASFTPSISCGSPNFTVQEVREAQVSFAGVVWVPASQSGPVTVMDTPAGEDVIEIGTVTPDPGVSMRT